MYLRQADSNIKSVLENIVYRRFKADAGRILLEDGLSLLSEEKGLKARDLVYLYFDIEKEFNIKISEDSINNGGFKTIEGIYALIKDAIGDAYIREDAI